MSEPELSQVTRMTAEDVAAGANTPTVGLVANPGQAGVHQPQPKINQSSLKSYFGAAAQIGGGVGLMAHAKNSITNETEATGMGQKVLNRAELIGGAALGVSGVNSAIKEKTGQDLGYWTKKIASETKNAVQNIGRS
jgi:hypothetical protein